jgi:hypothetical protein
MGDLPMRQGWFRKRKDSGSIEHLRTLGKKSLFNLMELTAIDHEVEGDLLQRGGEGRTSETLGLTREIVSRHDESTSNSMVSRKTRETTISSSSDFFDDGDEEEARRLELVLSQLDMGAYYMSCPSDKKIGSPVSLGQCGSPHFTCLKLVVLSVADGFYTSNNDSPTKHKEKVMRTSGRLRSVSLHGDGSSIDESTVTCTTNDPAKKGREEVF